MFTCNRIPYYRYCILIQETVTVFLHWQSKMATLLESSGKIVPVHLRTQPLDYYRPVTSLCDYKTNEVIS